MNDRGGTIVWLGALLVVLGVFLWPDPDRPADSRPISEDRHFAGLAGLRLWLDAGGVENLSLRHRYGELRKIAAPQTGNLLIVNIPGVLASENEEVDALRGWVAQGNTLLVVASIFETPFWQLESGSVHETLLRLTNLGLQRDHDAESATFEAGDDDPEQDLTDLLEVPTWIALSGATDSQTLIGTEEHPLTTDLGDIVVPWDGSRWTCCEQKETKSEAGHAEARTEHVSWQALLSQASAGQAVLWERAFGRGTFVVFGHPSVLSNAAIGQHDNRRFAMNLIATYVGPRGAVIFDDAHQGLNELYTAQSLWFDIRVLYTIGFLLLFWLAYVLADAGTWERLTATGESRAIGISDLIIASGGYLARRLQRGSVVAGLLEPLRDRLAHKWRLPPELALEEGLELERPHLEDDEIVDFIKTSRRRQRVNLVKLHNLLLGLRREIR
ncbi:MAG: DUF4350 domain-containing protein [Pseudomonadota bacterium]